MPLQATSGAASYDGFGGGVAVVPTYIEDVFSTYLYTGTGSPTGITVNNGIDLATKGGLLWCKNRTTGSTPHYLFDTARNFSYTNARSLNTATTDAQENQGTNFAKPETNGFSFGDGAGSSSPNINGAAFASWTFRKQPKFFDVVTWTGNSTVRTISHNLGSVPGCIIVKQTSAAGQSWYVYHRSIDITGGKVLVLNLTNAALSNGDIFNSTLATSTEFTIGIDSAVNYAGATNIAYLFAHDAGGFGLTGTDNVISCGSLSASTLTTVTLGYEPQWVMVKKSSGTGDWYMLDVMRGMSQTTGFILEANLSDADFNGGQLIVPTATGFLFNGSNFGSTSGETFIYIAIRRGPMRVPTLGTSVYNGITRNGTGAVAQVTGVGFTPDLVHSQERSGLGVGDNWADRLRGSTNNLTADTAAAEFNQPNMVSSLNMDGMSLGTDSSWAVNNSSGTYINHFLRRAPSFFDIVCYTGTGTAGQTFAHNLGVVPELMIVKKRNTVGDWCVYPAATGNTKALFLQLTDAVNAGSVGYWNTTNPTSSVFSLGNNSEVNFSTHTYVAYLFATCAGVSKVGSYTGTGAAQTINCGFTAGSRFVMIKRTDSTGDWYVWDSARGIVAGNDPYLLLNSTAAEVTNTDYVDTANSGFEISSTAPAGINANGGSFIFFAVS